MFIQVLEVLVDVDGLAVQLSYDFLQKIKSLAKFGMLLLYDCFVYAVAIRYVLDQLTELLVIENQSQDHGLVYVYRGELIAVAFVDHLSNLGEVFGYLWRALLHY